MYKLSLTQAQFQALCGLLDAGVRASGLRSVKDASELLHLFQAAEIEADRAVRIPQPVAPHSAETP